MGFFLGREPNHRKLMVTQKKLAGLSEDDVEDELLKRYIRGRDSRFVDDPIMETITSIPDSRRGYVEALRLGGASIQDIAEALDLGEETVDLILQWHFDIGEAYLKPILRGMIADAEEVSSIKNLKRFSAKRGWKAFIRQFMTPEESSESYKLTPEQIKRRAFMEVVERTDQAALYAPGTEELKQLTPYVKLYSDHARDLEVSEQVNNAVEQNIAKIMSMINEPNRIQNMKFLGKSGDRK